MSDKLEYNKQTIGKKVLVLNPTEKRVFTWEGTVVGVKDDDTFFVSNGERDFEVSMYNIRNLEGN